MTLFSFSFKATVLSMLWQGIKHYKHGMPHMTSCWHDG